MHEKGKILDLLGLMIAAALLFVALPATEAMAQGGATLTVCPDGSCNFTTIQAAVDAANVGDTINVAAGTYLEFLVIDKPLTLLGPNAGINPNSEVRVAEAVIEYPVGLAEDNDLVDVFADNVTIAGFTIDDSTAKR